MHAIHTSKRRAALAAAAVAMLAALCGPTAAQAGQRSCTAKAQLLSVATCTVVVTRSECDLRSSCAVDGSVSVRTASLGALALPALPGLANTRGSVTVKGHGAPFSLTATPLTKAASCGPRLLACAAAAPEDPHIAGFFQVVGTNDTTVTCSSARSVGLPTTTLTCTATWG